MTRAMVANSIGVLGAQALRLRLWMVVGSHFTVDVYSAVLPASLGVLEVRCNLTDNQSAFVLGFGSLVSGLSQPFAAWLSDHLDSRAAGPIGLLLAALCMSCIGLAGDIWTLLALLAIGLIGIGMYHPVGASSVGQIAERIGPNQRAMGISLFFVAGMGGGVTGAWAVSRLASLDQGFHYLMLLAIPGVIIAALLQVLVRHIPHRHDGHHDMSLTTSDSRVRWFNIAMLFGCNAMRFIVNIGLFYLYVRLAKSIVAQQQPGLTPEELAIDANPISGNFVAFSIIGMALGGLASGRAVRATKEKWWLIIVPIVLAPAIVLLPHVEGMAMNALALLAGIGFASMVPVTLSVAQRILPHRTSLASGIMLGGAWSFGFLGPQIADACIHHMSGGLESAFLVLGGVLVLSGLLAIPLLRVTESPSELVNGGTSTE